MLVRRALPEDANAAGEVMASVASEGVWILTEEPLDVAAWALRMQANPDPSWVLEDDGGRIIGLLGLHAVPRAEGVITLGMSIVAGARGKGGGKALMDAALAYAQATDVHKIELEVFPENARAVGLYARYGFAVEGLRREHYLRRDGTRRDALVMALILR